MLYSLQNPTKTPIAPAKLSGFPDVVKKCLQKIKVISFDLIKKASFKKISIDDLLQRRSKLSEVGLFW